MADASSHRAIEGLPNELTLNVFAFIRQTTDRKMVCLVNRQWRDLMAPILFETLSTNHLGPEIKLATLFHPSDGILKYVRKIHLSGHEEAGFDGDFGETTQDNLNMILCAMPRNALSSFTANNYITMQFLLPLLQHHQEIKYLDINMLDPGSIVEPKREPLKYALWSKLSPFLTKIETFRTKCGSDRAGGNPFEVFRNIIPRAPRLTRLSIRGDHGFSTLQNISKNIFDHTKTSEPPRRIALTSLSLYRLRLSNEGPVLLQHINFSSLRHLELLECQNMVPFLKAVTTYYEGTSCQLAHIRIDLQPKQPNMDDPSTTIRAIEKLISSFTGLQKLFVYVSAFKMIDLKSVRLHGGTLRYLGLTSSSVEEHSLISPSDLKQLVFSCNKLEQLALDLKAIDLGCVYQLGSEFKLNTALSQRSKSEYQELEQVLEFIAKLATLHTLRLFTVPTATYNGTPLLRSIKWGEVPESHTLMILMQRFAGQIFRFLADHGSKIRVLCINPYDTDLHFDYDEDYPPADENGHSWPRYFYLKGQSSDARGQKATFAAPVNNISKEYPGSDIATICREVYC